MNQASAGQEAGDQDQSLFFTWLATTSFQLFHFIYEYCRISA
jgi:hypothetical protein